MRNPERCAASAIVRASGGRRAAWAVWATIAGAMAMATASTSSATAPQPGGDQGAADAGGSSGELRQAEPGAALAPAAVQAEPTAAEASSARAAALTAVLASMSADERRYWQHVVALADPFFEGRAPGSRGGDLAAEYVEFHFKAAGLEPLFATTTKAADGTEVVTPRSTYRQTFMQGRRSVLKDQGLSFAVGAGEVAAGGGADGGVVLEAEKDFVAMGVTGSGSAEGPLVFVGYSLDDGPEGYDTYAAELAPDALRGKVALMLRFEPKTDKGISRWAGEGERWTGASSLMPKLAEAAERGASAVLVVAPPGADDPRATGLEPFRAGGGGRPAGMPVLQVTPEAARRLVSAAGGDLDALIARADAQGVFEALPGVNVKANVEVKREEVPTDNVGAVLPGAGELADEFVVIGAHYDHLGYGAFGSRDPRPQGKLHAGADDNASGTAGLLLAARRLAEQAGEGPRRSIVFVAFGAEESGLNGSRHFVRSGVLPASGVYAMLNMDMIGRLRTGRLEVAGVGTAEGFADLLAPVLAANGLDVKTLPGGQGPSDHASFYAGGVPVLHFFTGLHEEYHKPEDTYETINPVGAVRVVEAVEAVARLLAGRSEPLTFTRSRGPSMSRDTGAPAAGQGQTMAGVRVRFGISPGSYAEDQPGVPVGEVAEGTTAEAAGLKAGDRLMTWEGQEIADVSAWMGMLAKHKPGDVVTISYRRGSETITTTATLKARETNDR